MDAVQAKMPAGVSFAADRLCQFGASPFWVERIRLRNFKLFRNVSIGPLSKVCHFVGANGTGKSALFDAFAFVRDCMKHDVAVALDKRGGYREVKTREAEGRVGIELKFRTSLFGTRRVVTYVLEIGADAGGSPCVERETLSFRRGSHGSPCALIDFRKGHGEAVPGDTGITADTGDRLVPEKHIIDPRTLAVKKLGDLSRHKAYREIRDRIGRWHVSDFHLTAASHNGKSRPGEQLAADGRNLGKVARHLQTNHGDVFEEIRRKIGIFVPGIASVDTETLRDGRVRLLFRDSAYKEPFAASQVSDGTIQAFAYLVLLHEPKPHPLLCIEEPENLLYHSLMSDFAGEAHEYANRAEGQVMVATHSTRLLNDAHIDEVFWFTKQRGQAKIHKASRNAVLVGMAELGELPGELWATNFFEGAHPDE